MTDTSNATSAGETGTAAPDEIEHGELVLSSPPGSDESAPQNETVTAPAKVMRIGSMVKQLLEEAKAADLDEASRERLAEIYERSIVELSDALSPDLQQELHMLTLPFKEGIAPTISEIRVAHAQLVGWLEGLFHGIQATLFAQQLAARQQFEQMRGLSQGPGPGVDPRLAGAQMDPRLNNNSSADRPGTYL